MKIFFITAAAVVTFATGQSDPGIPRRVASAETKAYRNARFNHLHHAFNGDAVRATQRHIHDGVTPDTDDIPFESGCENVTLYYYKNAVVDNFAPVEAQETWYGNGQRYWVNPTNWGGPGYPVFVYIGGEGQESCTTLTDWSVMYALSQEHRALLVDIEHRFYGESYPTADMSTKNLTYLSSQQGLADLARLVTHVKNQYDTPSSQVITYGGSYPGNMASWFRLKYPSITLGSVGSSAPLIAKTNFSAYMDVVGEAMVYYSGQECYDAFESAANTVAANGADGPGSAGMQQLEQDFKTCEPITTNLDYATFLSDLMGNVQGTVQYNTESSAATVSDICETMLAGSDPYQQFIVLNDQYLEEYNSTCWDASWDSLVAYVGDPSYDPTNAYRPWVYQTCSEFGYYQTTDSPNQPFHSWTPLNVNYSQELCFACYDGWTDEPDVAWINNINGGVNISGTNIVFPAGTIDPWHALGVTNATKDYLPEETELSVYILGTSHCQDMYKPSPSDSAPLAAAKTTIMNTVGLWLTGSSNVDTTDDITTNDDADSNSNNNNHCSCSNDKVKTYSYIAYGIAGILFVICVVLSFKVYSLSSAGKEGLMSSQV